MDLQITSGSARSRAMAIPEILHHILALLDRPSLYACLQV